MEISKKEGPVKVTVIASLLVCRCGYLYVQIVSILFIIPYGKEDNEPHHRQDGEEERR